jgi:transcriptional regulator with XRE-family HTH domain
MDDAEAGQRIAYWRERRGMTQRLFAERIGRSLSWVEKVEAGTRSADRLTVLEKICEVLRVDLPVLLGRELPRDSEQCLAAAEVEALRAALERYDGLTAGAGGPAAGAPSPQQVRERVDYLWLAFEAGDYETAGRSLPAVLLDAQRAHSACRSAPTAGALAEAYQVAASTARKLGEFGVSWIAGDRAVATAEEAGDPLLAAAGAYRVANALLAMGRAGAAFALTASLADRLEPGMSAPPEQSMYGTMLLQAAIAGARKGDNRTSRDLIREADEVAGLVGPARNDYHTAFGPVNVGIHRVSALVELGEGGAAVKAAAAVPRQDLSRLPRERRANHLVDVARGYSQWGKREEALATLLEAEQLAPAEVRCRPAARATISDLAHRSGGAAPPLLAQLAARAGVPA